jgi:hypothetical protein
VSKCVRLGPPESASHESVWCSFFAARKALITLVPTLRSSPERGAGLDVPQLCLLRCRGRR